MIAWGVRIRSEWIQRLTSATAPPSGVLFKSRVESHTWCARAFAASYSTYAAWRNSSASSERTYRRPARHLRNAGRRDWRSLAAAVCRRSSKAPSSSSPSSWGNCGKCKAYDIRFKVRGGRCKVNGGRCKVNATRCKVRGAWWQLQGSWWQAMVARV